MAIRAPTFGMIDDIGFVAFIFFWSALRSYCHRRVRREGSGWRVLFIRLT